MWLLDGYGAARATCLLGSPVRLATVAPYTTMLPDSISAVTERPGRKRQRAQEGTRRLLLVVRRRKEPRRPA